MSVRAACACLAVLSILPLIGGCSDGDEVVVTNEVPDLNFRGTDARDTLDLNIGTNAGFNSDDNGGFFTGPEGQILMLFKQQHETPGYFGPIPEALTGPFNYARVITDAPGPIMAVDDHTDPNYEDSIEFQRQSWNLRYVALLNQCSSDFGTPMLKLVVWDFSTGQFTTAARIADANFFMTWGFGQYLEAVDLFVDNNGRVTVLFRAIDANSADGTDFSLWVVQYDTTTQLITRTPTIVSGAFQQPGNSQNRADYFDGRIAANGDIAILFFRVDNFGAAGPNFISVLHSVVYKATPNTWAAAKRADNGLDDRFGAPVGAPINVVLDTDANSFQYAFIQNSDGFGGNLPAVYTSRFIANAAADFPAPTRVDTTTAAGLHRVANPLGGGIDVFFGRSGASLVHWVQTETGQGPPIDTIWMSHSGNSVAPATANSAELLNASLPTHGGYTVAQGRASITAQPEVAFDSADNAIIAFRVFNNDATSDAEVYVATFNGTAITPATVGTGNLATQPTPAAGQTRLVNSLQTSGFSGGANPTCVVCWSTELRGGNGNLISSAQWGLAFNGLAPAGAAAQIDSTTGSTSVGQVFLASSNRFSSVGKVEIGIGDRKLVTDEYPAYGTGSVWLINLRLMPPASPSMSNTYDEVRMISFNPAVHGNVVSNGTTMANPGQVARADSWALPSDGGVDFAYGVMGLYSQRSYMPSAGAGADPAASAAQLLNPPDMKQVSSQVPNGVHVDGMNWVRTSSGNTVTSVLVNVPRRWSFWMASDTRSQRIFGVRSR